MEHSAPEAAEEPSSKKPRKESTSPLARRRRQKVVVRVPATSANLGPGFDALGTSIQSAL